MAAVVDWGFSTQKGSCERCPNTEGGHYAIISTDMPPVTTRVRLCGVCYDELRRAQQLLENWLSNGACSFTSIAGLIPAHG